METVVRIESLELDYDIDILRYREGKHKEYLGIERIDGEITYYVKVESLGTLLKECYLNFHGDDYVNGGLMVYFKNEDVVIENVRGVSTSHILGHSLGKTTHIKDRVARIQDLFGVIENVLFEMDERSNFNNLFRGDWPYSKGLLED